MTARRVGARRRARAAAGRAGAAAGTVLAAAACASPGTPPGGPERRTPPRVVRVSPESGAVNVRPREVVFEYDAVVSETPRGGSGGAGGGATGLETLVTVSPRSGSVAVDWRRERIAVRPRRGFRPNVTYTVTVLPGIQDLRSNVRDTATVAVFSTGGPIAAAALRGVVYDWVNNRPAARAVVEATAADSTVYFAVADSAGRFVVPNVPAGAYLVRGTVDVNLNRTADPREPFDTARSTAAPPAAAARDTGGLALYAFAHDTVAARLTNVAASDSVTLRLTFDRPLRPDQPFAGRVRVVAADSSPVAVRGVFTAAAADSIAQAETRAAQPTAPGDSARRPAGAGADTTAGPAPPPAPGSPAGPPTQAPRLGRPIPPTELVVRLAAPLRANTVFRVRAVDLRSLSNVVGTSERTFTSPRAPRAAPPAAPAATPPAATPPRATPPAATPPAARPPAAPATPPPAAPPAPRASPPPARGQ